MWKTKPKAWLNKEMGMATADPTTKDRYPGTYIPLYTKMSWLAKGGYITGMLYMLITKAVPFLKDMLTYCAIAIPLLIVLDQIISRYTWDTETNVLWGWGFGILYMAVAEAVDKLRNKK